MSRFHWKYFILTLVLVIVVFGLTLLFFPEWAKSNGLLLTIVGGIIVAVVGFVADWRTAFERMPSSQSPSDLNSETVITSNTTYNQKSGIEVNAPIQGPQVGGITINLPGGLEQKNDPEISIKGSDDSKISGISWEYRDSRLLRIYFGKCADFEPALFKDLADNEIGVRDYLISSGLACFTGGGQIRLTWGGVLLCCQRQHIPRDKFHVHVKFKQDSGEESLNEELFGSTLHLYYELYDRLKPLFQRRMGSPETRDGSGAEKVFFEYPEVAIVEALANFLIHRDYSLDDKGFITIHPDRIVFINPGQSEVPPEELMSATFELRPVYKRNQRLIEAINKARINQAEGGGFLRIKRSLIQNESYLSTGELGLSIRNDPINNRFELIIYRRDLKPIFSVLHQLPSPPRDFTGREAELAELLANFDKGVTISGLHGQGGIGKTALALKLAEQLAPRYPDAQFFLDLKGVNPQPLTTAEVLAHVIRAYHPTARLPEGEAEMRGLYLSVLHGQRALLLMDNAKDAAQVELLLPPATSCLLVTSRQHFTLPGLPSKNLEQLPPPDARELLLKIAPRLAPPPSPTLPPSGSSPIGEGSTPSPIGGFSDGGGREGVDQIAKLCGYLPLALRLSASALAERVDLSPADLIRRLTDTQQRLKLTGAEASLQLSYDLLTPELQTLWRALAVFPDSFDRAAAAAVWELQVDKTRDALSEFVRYSVLDYAPHPNPPAPLRSGGHGLPKGERESLDDESLSPAGRGDRGEGEPAGHYRLHDLARLYAASRLKESKRAAAQQRHAVHYLTVLRVADELYLRGGEAIRRGLELFDLEWMNIEVGQAWAAANAEKDDTAAQLCSDYPDVGAYVLELRQHPRERIRWLEVALATVNRLRQRDTEGRHLSNLGLAYTNLGEMRKAIDFYEQALMIARQVGGQRGEGNVLGSLGNAYADLGEIRKAIEYYEQQLVVTRKISDRRGEGNALGSLGNAYADLGETHKAIEYYEQALIIDREIGDRRGEGVALGNLGLASSVLGEIHKAIEFYEQQLVITREIGDRRSAGNALGNLGNTYAALGKIRQAIKYYEQAMVIDREIGDRRGEATDLWNMSLALDKLGERAQAIAHAQAALKIREEIEDPRAGKVREQLEAWG